MKTTHLLNELADQATRIKYPSLPDYALPKKKYKDTTANGLTTCIIDFIRFSGGYAARINTQGNYSEKLGKWIKSGSTVGTSDIIACIDGRFISIEVKIGRDIMSDAQLKAEKNVNASGGLYFVAKDLPSFIEWFNQNFPQCRQQ